MALFQVTKAVSGALNVTSIVGGTTYTATAPCTVIVSEVSYVTDGEVQSGLTTTGTVIESMAGSNGGDFFDNNGNLTTAGGVARCITAIIELDTNDTITVTPSENSHLGVMVLG